jgi:hypothetical protein
MNSELRVRSYEGKKGEPKSLFLVIGSELRTKHFELEQGESQ